MTTFTRTAPRANTRNYRTPSQSLCQRLSETRGFRRWTHMGFMNLGTFQ